MPKFDETICAEYLILRTTMENPESMEAIISLRAVARAYANLCDAMKQPELARFFEEEIVRLRPIFDRLLSADESDRRGSADIDVSPTDGT